MNVDFLKPVNVRNKIRLGNNYDGGYIVYGKGLSDIDMLLTYGVGWDVQFEADLNTRCGTNVLMFDPTMFGKTMLDLKKLAAMLKSLRMYAAGKYIFSIWQFWKIKRHLEKKGVVFNNEGLAKVNRPKYSTFAGHLERFGLKNKRLMLKIDIEGDEYDVLDDEFMHNLNCVDQLIIEFHSLDRRIDELHYIIRKLKKDFNLIHIHGNNFENSFTYNKQEGNINERIEIPIVLECTFLRRSVIAETDIIYEPVTYPIENLDYPNNLLKEDIMLRFI